jgi:hypothetical protein
MERKVIARSVVMVGLLAGAFLAGSLLFGNSPRTAGSGQDFAGASTPHPTATIPPAAVQPAATITPTAAPPVVADTGAGTLQPVGSGSDVQDNAGPGAGGGNGVGNGGSGHTSADTPAPLEPQAPQTPPAQPPGPPTLEPPATQPPAPEPPTPVPPAPEPVNEAPFVAETLPADDAIGVLPNTGIEIVFSEPMDQASAEAAFSLNPEVSGAFSWDPEGRTMTFTPDAPFEYNTLVEWQVAPTAADESGLEMASSFASSFRVLRQKTIKLYSQPSNDGYVFAPPVAAPQKVVTAGGSHNALLVGTWTRGFLSFDLGKLPADTVAITGAELHVHQRAHHAQAYTGETGALWVVTLPYGDLDIGDYATPTPTVCPNLCFPLGLELSGSAADGWKSTDVTLLVQQDWKAGKGDIGSLAIGPTEKLSQFRLQFLNENKGAGPDVWAEFHSGEAGGMAPRLQITYLLP